MSTVAEHASQLSLEFDYLLTPRKNVSRVPVPSDQRTKLRRLQIACCIRQRLIGHTVFAQRFQQAL